MSSYSYTTFNFLKMAKSPLFRNHRFLQDTDLASLIIVFFCLILMLFWNLWLFIIIWIWRKNLENFKHFQSFSTLKIFWLKIFRLYDFIDFEKFFNFEKFLTSENFSPFENVSTFNFFFFGTFLTGKFFRL